MYSRAPAEKPSPPSNPVGTGACAGVPMAIPVALWSMVESQPSFSMEYAAQSDVGRVRQANEDAHGQGEVGHGRLFVVADGMGGHQSGDVASRLAVKSILEMFRDSTAIDPSRRLMEALKSAHDRIMARQGQRTGRDRMGTTAVALYITADLAYYAWVGDSRIYLVRDGQLSAITRDHTVGRELLERGVLSFEELVAHPDGHKLSRALGMDNQWHPEAAPTPLALETGDMFLLCTDGLYRRVPEGDVLSVMLANAAQGAAHRLVSLANDAGGDDNITVQVVHVGSREAAVEAAAREGNIGSLTTELQALVASDLVDTDTGSRPSTERLGPPDIPVPEALDESPPTDLDEPPTIRIGPGDTMETEPVGTPVEAAAPALEAAPAPQPAPQPPRAATIPAGPNEPTVRIMPALAYPPDGQAIGPGATDSGERAAAEAASMPELDEDEASAATPDAMRAVQPAAPRPEPEDNSPPTPAEVPAEASTAPVQLTEMEPRPRTRVARRTEEVDEVAQWKRQGMSRVLIIVGTVFALLIVALVVVLAFVAASLLFPGGRRPAEGPRLVTSGGAADTADLVERDPAMAGAASAIRAIPELEDCEGQWSLLREHHEVLSVDAYTTRDLSGRVYRCYDHQAYLSVQAFRDEPVESTRKQAIRKLGNTRRFLEPAPRADATLRSVAAAVREDLGPLEVERRLGELGAWDAMLQTPGLM